MKHNHKIIKCRKCKAVIQQCRCFKKEKDVQWSICGSCLVTNVLKFAFVFMMIANPAYALEMPWQGQNEPTITKKYKADHLAVMTLCGYGATKLLTEAKTKNIFTRNPKTSAFFLCILPMVAKEQWIDKKHTALDHFANGLGFTLGLAILKW